MGNRFRWFQWEAYFCGWDVLGFRETYNVCEFLFGCLVVSVSGGRPEEFGGMGAGRNASSFAR